jgi:O-antigen ligase
VTLRARVAFAALALFLSIAYVPFFAGDIAKWLVLSVAIGFLAFVPIKYDRIDGAALAFVAWAWLSLMWSPDPRWGAVHGLEITTLAALFIGLRRVEIPPWVFPLGALGVLGMLTVAMYGSFQNENFTTEYLLIALPFLLVKRLYWPVAAVVAIYLIWFNDSILELIALAGVAVWLIWRWNRYAAVAIGGIGVIGVLAYYTGDNLWFRVAMWADTLVMWADAPFFGHGLGSFNYLYPDYMMASDVGADQFFNSQMWAVAAHNEYVQLLAELGVVGFGLAGAFIWLVHGYSSKRSGIQTAALASLVIAASLAFMEFPLQNAGTGALVAVGFAILTRQSIPGRGISVPLAVVSLTGVVAAGFMALNNWHYERADNLAMVNPQDALVEITHAYNVFPADIRTRMMVFRYLVHLQETVPAAINRDLADGLYEISRSAIPGYPQLLIDRIDYLARVQRCEEECGEIMNWLLRNAYNVGEVQRLKQGLNL